MFSITSGPSGRTGRPSGGLCDRVRRRGCRRVGCPWPAPPLYEGFWLLAPRPRCEGGSCPESQSGGGHGLGIGGGGVGCPLATSFFPAGAGAGMTDSRRVRLEAGSPSCPPWARSAISFLAATLLAFEVRWIPSPAQMLAPSTVVRSWGRDSQEPKNLRMLINLAFPVRSPAAAASNKLFSAPENLAVNSPDRRLDTWSVSLQQADRTYLGRGIMKTTFAPPTKARAFSRCLKQF
jgi:hypothetical protein